MLIQTNRRRPGFTLLELVIVIAVILILVGVLFPVIYSGKKRTKVNSCLNNQKQIAMAVLQYADEYQGKLPCGVLHTNKGNITWDTQLTKYIEDERLFKCPDDPTGGTRSYGYNDQAFRRKQDYGHTVMILSQINPASKYVVITDFHNKANEVGSPSYAMSYFAPGKEDQYHSNKTENNYAFFDGHVATKKLGKITNASFVFEVGE